LDKLIIDAYTGENERLKQILDIVSHLEERYSEMSSLEDAHSDLFLIKIEELTGIYRFDLSIPNVKGCLWKGRLHF
jgi:hypothetical protein